MLSKTYQPSLTAGLVQRWKAELVKNGHERIGNLDLFPGWTDNLQKEHASQNGSLAEGTKFIRFHLIVVEEKIGRIDVQDGVSGIGERINGTGNLKI